MKKSIIVLALALLMVAPMFAATVNALVANDTVGDREILETKDSSTLKKDTDVKVVLKQYPKYLVAITTADYSENKINNTNFADVKHEDLIVMDVDKDNWTLLDKTGYYLTYFAYENNQKVNYSVKLSGNMKLQESSGTVTATSNDKNSVDNQKEIRYTMTIENSALGDSYDLSSTDTDEHVFKTIAATNLIGKYESGSFKFTLKKYGKDTVQYNIVGEYKATVTLKIYTD